MPSQVTWPLSPTEQLRSTAEQIEVLALPWQETVVPSPQLAMAKHRWGGGGQTQWLCWGA